jgi:hypothetical protein
VFISRQSTDAGRRWLFLSVHRQTVNRCLLSCCAHLQDTIREARQQQIHATDLLARLLQAPDAKAIAAEHVDSLTEEFFIMSSTYLDMVRAQFLPLKTHCRCITMLLFGFSTKAGCDLCRLPPSQARKEGNPDVSGKLEQVLW